MMACVNLLCLSAHIARDYDVFFEVARTLTATASPDDDDKRSSFESPIKMVSKKIKSYASAVKSAPLKTTETATDDKTFAGLTVLTPWAKKKKQLTKDEKRILSEKARVSMGASPIRNEERFL